MIVCHQYRILDFANWKAARRLLALSRQFGTCDHEDASSVGRKDEKRLALSQGCTVDVRDTPIQISATRLPLLGRLGSSVFKLKDTHRSECGEWLDLWLVFRSCRCGCCMEVVYTCRSSLFPSLAAEFIYLLIDWFAIGFKPLWSRCS